MLNRNNTQTEATNLESIYSTVTSNPDALTNEHIQTIGKLYIEKYGERRGFFHSNQPIAQSMKKYDKETTVDVKWKFLADAFGCLENANGYLATTIDTLFSKAFNKEKITKEYGGYYGPFSSEASITVPLAVHKERFNQIASEYFMKKQIANLESRLETQLRPK